MKENNKTKEIEELVDDWIEQINMDSQNPMTTGFPSIDADMKNKYRGKVGAIIGYGGSKKSLFALQSMNNVTQSNLRGIYSNMEMANYQLFSRILDQSFDIEQCTSNNSEYMEHLYLNGKLDIPRVKEKLNSRYSNRLLVTQQNRMCAEDYHKVILRTKEKYGDVDILVVDGLSMMKTDQSETISYTTNSGELKDLAKEHNIYIPLICHLSKGAEKHTRDVQRFVRGSEKILDNIDFVVQMSQIQDRLDPTQYRNDKGYIRFYNKRGTGNTISKIFDFDSTKLWMTETDENPAQYELEQEEPKNKYRF